MINPSGVAGSGDQVHRDLPHRSEPTRGQAIDEVSRPAFGRSIAEGIRGMQADPGVVGSQAPCPPGFRVGSPCERPEAAAANTLAGRRQSGLDLWHGGWLTQNHVDLVEDPLVISPATALQALEEIQRPDQGSPHGLLTGIHAGPAGRLDVPDRPSR